MNCLQCGKRLSVKQIKRGCKTCSVLCRNRYRYKDVKKEYVCCGCGKVYIKKNSGTKIGIKYCSQQCASKTIGSKPKSKKHKQHMADAQRHIRIEGFFRCDRCGREFNTNTSLRAHKSHCGHTLATVVCLECGREFIGKASLRLHESHHDKNCKWNINHLNGIYRKILSDFRCIDTDIERAIKSELEKRAILYEHQFFVARHPYDFYIPRYNLLLEADGDWWHGRDEMGLRKFQVKARINDIEQTRQAVIYGYKIVRFWGTDLLKNVSACVDEVVSYANTGRIGILARKMEG